MGIAVAGENIEYDVSKANPATRSIPIIAVTSHALMGKNRQRERQDVMTMCRSLTVLGTSWRKFSSACANSLRSIAAS
jgi:hypothetical protein